MALAATYTRPGDPAEVIEVVEVDDPTEVSQGQVLIRVVAFPIHRGDLQAIAGVDPAGRVLRAVIEATRVVEAVAPGVAGLQKGQRVSVFAQPGGWSQWATAEAQFVVPVSDVVSDKVGAQMLVNPITVLMLRREAEKHFSTGYDGVVINNAAGGSVGRLFTAVCQHHHIATISVVLRVPIDFNNDSQTCLWHRRTTTLGCYSDIPSHWPNSVLSQCLPRFYSALVVPQGPASGQDLIFRYPRVVLIFCYPGVVLTIGRCRSPLRPRPSR